MMKILFIQTESRYGLAIMFLEGYAQASKEIGHDICFIRPALDGAEKLYKAYLERPDLTISFNGFGLYREKQPVFHDLKISHLCMLGDNPAYFPEFLSCQSPYLTFSCNDRKGCQFIDKNYKQNTFFLPPAAAHVSNDYKSQKEFQLVMLGSLIDYEEIQNRWENEYPDFLSKVLNTACNLFIKNASCSLQESIDNSFLEIGMEIEEEQRLRFYHDYICEIDQYIRGKRIFFTTTIENWMN